MLTVKPLSAKNSALLAKQIARLWGKIRTAQAQLAELLKKVTICR